ncbi:hypothetical protein HYU23_00530 [Candidatus Woesearchaeota archaeon]|nr:hypothetical protein [Candidatus Woesearchaeota archaeon]
MDDVTKLEILKEFELKAYYRLDTLMKLFRRDLEKHNKFWRSVRVSMNYYIDPYLDYILRIGPGHQYILKESRRDLRCFKCDFYVFVNKAIIAPNDNLFEGKLLLFFELDYDDKSTHEEIIETVVFPEISLSLHSLATESKDFNKIRHFLIEISPDILKFRRSIGEEFGMAEEKIKITGFGSDLL